MILHSNTFGEGRPLIILHGFLGMGDNWKTIGRQFADSNFQVHLLDQRNHGRSFHAEGFDYDVMAEDLKYYCNNYSLSNMVLLGHSMGGKTAMRFATEYPNLVNRLIVADISPRYYPVHHDTILAGLSSLDFSLISSRSQADQVLSDYVPEFGIRQFLLKNLYWVNKEQLGLRVNLPVLKEQVSEVGEALPSHATFSKPTLFLKGDKSEYIGESDEAIIHRHFSDVKIETISNAGHWLHAENPKEFFRQVLEFIR